MVSDGRRQGAAAPGDATGEAFELLLAEAPGAFAITRGAGHVLTFSNRAFRELTYTDGGTPTGQPFALGALIPGLLDLLDRAHRDRRALQGHLAGGSLENDAWHCSVWPVALADGAPGLVLALQPAALLEPDIDLQRAVAERMLLGALREREATDVAAASQERAAFLADAGHRLAESIDEDATREAIAGLHLPKRAAWCIVDVIEADGVPRRLAIIHPDPGKQDIARRLARDWSPEPDDAFGAPAMLRAAEPVAIADNVDAVLARGSLDADQVHALHELGMGSLLTVPMVSHGSVLGAITFVGTTPGGAFTKQETHLAGELGARSAMALENARLYTESVELRAREQQASHAKSDFLAHMSHELRTPLNAIGGYVDLIDLGIHGPVTDAQRADLVRIRVSQQHLLVMINEILNFMHVDSGSVNYHYADVPVANALADAFAMVEPLIQQKRLEKGGVTCDADLMVRADADRLLQILINLLSNVVKFTPAGGRVAIACDAADDMVNMTVSDTGIGIAPDKLHAVFEPFMQVKGGLTERQGGVGLGLAISRDLARAMGGDLTVESTLGDGSRFTVSLPRVLPPNASD